MVQNCTKCTAAQWRATVEQHAKSARKGLVNTDPGVFEQSENCRFFTISQLMLRESPIIPGGRANAEQ